MITRFSNLGVTAAQVDCIVERHRGESKNKHSIDDSGKNLPCEWESFELNRSLDMGSSQGFSKREIWYIFSLSNGPLEKEGRSEAGVGMSKVFEDRSKVFEDKVGMGSIAEWRFVLGADRRQTAWDRCLCLVHFGQKSILNASV